MVSDSTTVRILLLSGRAEGLRALLRDCKRRGMTAPVLAVGDGAWLRGCPGLATAATRASIFSLPNR